MLPQSPRARFLAALCLGGQLLALPGLSAAASWQFQVRNPEGQPLADAVVAVEIKGPTRTTSARAEIAQRERRFIPNVLVVQTGTAVSFPNQDTVRHHVYSFSPAKRFDIKLYAGTPAEPIVFDKPGVAPLGCNIHDRMSAFVVVVDTPVFGKTDEQGLLTLDIPPGEHVLRLWHPSRLQPQLVEQKFSVAAGQASGQSSLVLTPQ
ncbi:methylamine utilization protein [Pelomonas sp. APW6]|uniref:Methylamine utilization protein n=1 Tax=Roseateles subflavus TaxID=3053353 RepID=A0ABT7LE13_9BURK|nr:methylamine utilization protein [Pelomonas sp. APW6]MDL5031109.1 methylamine utilization protein [Pelomonas sp. APW6]